MIRKLLPVLLVLVAPMVANSQIVSQQLELLDQWSFDASLQVISMHGFSDCHNREFVALGHSNGIEFLELTAADTLLYRGSYVGADGVQIWSMADYQDRLYLMNDAVPGELLVLDITSISDSLLIQEFKLEEIVVPSRLWVDATSRIMYVCGIAAADLQFFDLSENRSQPHFLKTAHLSGGIVTDLFPENDTLFVAHGTNGLTIYDDNNNNDTLSIISQWQNEFFNVSTARPAKDRTGIYLQTNGAIPGIIRVPFPLENPYSISAIYQSFPEGLPAQPVNFNIRGQHGFIAYENAGIEIMDLSIVDTLFRIAYARQDSVNYEQFFAGLPSDRLLAFNDQNNLEIFSINNITLETVPQDFLYEILPNVSGPLLPCEGDEILLSVPLQADHYRWFLNEAMVGDSSLYRATESGNYHTVLEIGRCVYESNPINFEFGELPDLSDIMGDTVRACPQEVVTLAKPSIVDWDFSVWLKDGNVLPNTSDFIQIVTDGTYRLLASNGACETVSAATRVEFVSIPDLDIEWTGTELKVMSGFEFQWYFNDTIIEGETFNRLVPLEAGSYTVELITEEGCTFFTDPFIFRLTANENLEVDKVVKIYPNPANNKVRISLPTSVTDFSFSINDITGKEMYRSQKSNAPSEITINTSNYQAGIYFIKWKKETMTGQEILTIIK